MKILILAENLEINRTSSGIRSFKQIMLYKQEFSSIDVITSTDESLTQKINGIKYHFLKLKPENENNWIYKFFKSRALQNILFGLDHLKHKQIKQWERATIKLLDNNYDLVVSLSSGASFLPAYAAHYLKNTFKFKHLLFVHDPFPLNQYPPPYQHANSLPYQSVSKLFGKVLKSADILSFPSQRLMEWMTNFYPFVIDKSIIQPHIGLYLKEIKSILPGLKMEKFSLFSKGLNIVHTGSLLGPRNPYYLINALEKIFITIPETKNIIHVHIIGKMNNIWKAEELMSDNIHIYANRVSYLESLNIQQNAEVLLLIEAASNISPFMPGKLADYLIAKKPILALTPKTSETTRILGSNYQLLANNGDFRRIYDTLVLIYESYINDELNKLIPSQKSFEYVRPENWIRQLDSFKTIK